MGRFVDAVRRRCARKVMVFFMFVMMANFLTYEDETGETCSAYC